MLDAIDGLISETPAIALSFEEIEAPTRVGFGFRNDRSFDMDQTGFTMPSFGFTGIKTLLGLFR